MNYKYQYIDDASRAALITANSDKVLIEEDNITEGNFLIFSDVVPLENQLQNLNNTTNMVLLAQEGIL
jgi:hypothetical protein